MTKEQILEKHRKHLLTITDFNAILAAMDEYAASQNKVLIDALNQIRSMKREAGETTDTYAFNRCWHIAIDALASYAEQAPQETGINLSPDEYLDLSILSDEEKKKVLSGFTENVSKDCLRMFLSLGLDNHFTQGVVNQDTDELFELSFRKMIPGSQVTGKSAEANFVAEAEWKRRNFGNKMYAENWWSNAPVDVRVAIEDMLIYYDQMLGSLNQSKEAGGKQKDKKNV